MNIALIDYRAGNLTSVRKALGAVGAEVYTPEAGRRTAERGRHHRARRRPLQRDRHAGRALARGRARARRRSEAPAARHLPRPAMAVRRQRGSAGSAGHRPAAGTLSSAARARPESAARRLEHARYSGRRTVAEGRRPKARRRRACCGTCPIRRMRISRIRTSRRSPMRAWRRPRTDRRSRRWWNAAS